MNATGRAVFVTSSVALILTAGGARATCRTPSPLLARTAAAKSYVDRYNALAAEDPYLLTGSATARWQTLVDDIKRSGEAPADLVARSEMMLAGSRGGDDAVASSLALAQDALALAESHHITDGSLHAALLVMVAAKEAIAGKAAQAVIHADIALAETERADGLEGWAYGNAALNAAGAHHANGDYVSAERLIAISERLAIACLPPDSPMIGGTIQRHAATLDTLGRTDEALGEGERALAWDVAHLPESDVALAEAMEAVGFTLFNANRLREAEAVMRRAVDLHARYRPHDPVWRASVTGKLGRILAAEEKYREAEAIFLAAQDLYAQTHDLTNPLAGSGELRRAGDAAQAQGKLDEALDLRRRALALMETRVKPRHPELARARIEYAATLAVTGRKREALAIAEPAVALLRETAPAGDPKRMGAEMSYALVASAAGVDAASLQAEVAPVAARMEAMLLDAATSRGELVNLAPTFARSFTAAAKLALAAYDEEAAFHALQLANLSEIVLVNAEVAARAAATAPAIRALVERREASARDQRRLDRDRLAAYAGGDTAKVLALDAEIRRNGEESAAATHDLDRAFPAYRSLSRPAPVALAAFRARLGADDVLLAPLSLPGETLVVAVTRAGLRWTTIAAPRSRVTALVERIRASIDAARHAPDGRFDTAAARSLARLLLPSALAPVIAAHRHLVYYASGSLATVPPALLITAPAQRRGAPAWLIRSHSVSIAIGLAHRPNADRPARDGFLGIGAPAIDGAPLTAAPPNAAASVDDFGTATAAALPPLPNAARELRAMGAMFPATQRRLLLGTAATKPAVESLPLDQYGVIVFATHGLVADALPGLTQPALVLTPAPGAGPANDGLLTAGEIAGLHLDADWVILSACNTAGGSDPQGSSYGGLASAFIQAGARALLVTHWPVRDDAAARITIATLAASRRGLDRASALQRAMLALMRDRTVAGAANPAIWAPFVLVDQ